MANIKDQVGEQSQPTGGGMRRVLNDGSESLAELRDFMQRLRGKSPQEVLGDVANSSLVQSTVMATIGFAVVIVGLSFLSYSWNKAFAADKPAQAAAKSAPAAETDADSQAQPTAQAKAADPVGVAATPTGDTTKNVDTTKNGDTTSGDPLLDTLGSGETKQADPKKNPLESSLDNLLDDTK